MQLPEAIGIRLTNSWDLYPALHHSGDTGLPMLVVENALARAVICLQGAQMMAFAPTGQREMLWISPQCVLQAGSPIRAGIPLCLPWFGRYADATALHGFARTAMWSVVGARATQDGATRVTLEFSSDAKTCESWPYAFVFRLDIAVGTALMLDMTAENRSQDVVPLSFAFHSYFAIPDIASARVGGLNETVFIDKADNFARKMQGGDVTISEFTDRIYLDVAPRQTLTTAHRSIAIESNCRCAVVWNAWSRDKNVEDMGAGSHVGYLCVERGDVSDLSVSLPPGDTYQAWMSLSSASFAASNVPTRHV